jgi:hypothetical protein
MPRFNSIGFCLYETTNGIKRHLAIDTLGFPFFTHCTKASCSDDWGLIEMFIKNIDYFKLKPVCIPKITILLDNGYQLRKTNHSVREDLSIDDDKNQI